MASSTVRPGSEDLPRSGDHERTPAVLVPIRTDHDVVEARRRGRSVAEGQGFSPVDVTLITTAISEVARNIVTHAGSGQVQVNVVEVQGRLAVEVTARDE